MAKVISQLPSGGSVPKHNNLLGLNEGDYLHLTQSEKAKLDGIQSGAEVNVNADWNAVSGDAQLLNKPTSFPPSTHTHTKSQITDFAHTHPISDVTGLPTALDDLQLNKEDRANKAIDFTTVNNTLYPSVQAVKTEIINSKNYVSVKDYGAVGDGVTDDTPAINSALTYCETIKGTLFFPSGNYLTTGNFIINSKISIKGEGEPLNIITNPLPTVFNAGSSNIISSSTTNNLFVVNADGVSFENLTLSCSAGTTSGAGVLFNKGNVMRMNNVGVRSFNINVDVVNGTSWNISNCDFYNPITNNIRINHLLLKDGGDQSIFSCNFFTGSRTAITHLLYRGGGGLKITNSKFNQGGVTAALAKECIKLVNDVGDTGDFLVSNSSFENYTDRAINISPVFQFDNIIINGNQFSASVTTSIDVILIGTSLAHKVIIANNIIDEAVNGVNYALGVKVSVDNNLFGSNITNRYVYPAPFYPKIIPSKVSIGNLDPQYNFNVYSDNDKTVNAYNVVSSVLSKDASSEQGLFYILKGGASASDRYAEVTSYENGFGGLPLVFQSLGAGKVFINKTTDDGTGAELQVNGTISASPATTANQVVVKSQLDAKFNTPTGLTTNYLTKWNGSGFGNSSIFDDGTNVGIGTNALIAKFQVSLGNDKNIGFYEDGEAGISSFTDGATDNAPLAFNATEHIFKIRGVAKAKILNNGNLLVNKTDDDLTNKLQVAGTISASPATTANQVPTWGQVQAAASSGGYTPTVNVITGVTSVSVQSHTYIKIGNIVTVYGESKPTPVVTGVTVIYEISLPIARANTTTKAIGFGSINVAGGSTNQFVRLESTSATTVRISFNVNAAGTPSVLYSFQYDITQ